MHAVTVTRAGKLLYAGDDLDYGRDVAYRAESGANIFLRFNGKIIFSRFFNLIGA